jgi:hypothetical protein
LEISDGFTKKYHWEMCDMLDMPQISQVCLLNGAKMQYAEFFCQLGIFLVSSQDVGTGATWQIPR